MSHSAPTSITPARRRRGVASVMAMMFMVIFSALALGFYAATTTASQLADNEKRSASAQSAAESGFQFLRYHLAALDIPPGLTNAQLFEEVRMQLEGRLNGTGNCNGGNIGYDPGLDTITIPENGYVKLDLDGKEQFKVTITRAGDQLITRVTGRSGAHTFGRAIELKFSKAKNASAIFNFGVASRGMVKTTGSSTITGLTDKTKGSILSTSTAATPVELYGKQVSGDVSLVSATGTVKLGSNIWVGDPPTNNHTAIQKYHVHKGVPEPKFPYVDTNVYGQYATEYWDGTSTYLENVRIPKDTVHTFSGDTVIRGVLFIEGSCNLTFNGNVDIQGVIVTDNNAPPPVYDVDPMIAPPTIITNNVLDFSGSVTARPMDDPNSRLTGAQFDEVKKLKGAFILAPTYLVKMWGNFATVGGTVVAAQFKMGGSAEGTIAGSVIQMDERVPTTIDGSADVVIASTGTTEYPPGISFGEHYTPVPGSYLEVRAD